MRDRRRRAPVPRGGCGAGYKSVSDLVLAPLAGAVALGALSTAHRLQEAVLAFAAIATFQRRQMDRWWPATPTFFESNPAEVRVEGPKKGLRVLGDRDAARAVDALDDAQREKKPLCSMASRRATS